jgi:hypothetical protein
MTRQEVERELMDEICPERIMPEDNPLAFKCLADMNPFQVGDKCIDERIARRAAEERVKELEGNLEEATKLAQPYFSRVAAYDDGFLHGRRDGIEEAAKFLEEKYDAGYSYGMKFTADEIRILKGDTP